MVKLGAVRYMLSNFKSPKTENQMNFLHNHARPTKRTDFKSPNCASGITTSRKVKFPTLTRDGRFCRWDFTCDLSTFDISLGSSPWHKTWTTVRCKKMSNIHKVHSTTEYPKQATSRSLSQVDHNMLIHVTLTCRARSFSHSTATLLKPHWVIGLSI